MSDAFYKTVRALGLHVFWLSSRPVVEGLGRVPREGPCLIVCNHTTPYDVPLLIRHTPRPVDFVSITEAFERPLLAWFYASLNAFPLDRRGPDASAVRTILDRLGRGRAVLMFAEGGIRRGERSVVRSGALTPGVGRIARLAGAPVTPAVVVNSVAYGRVWSWLPLRRVRYALAFGAPISPELSAAEIESAVTASMRSLYERVAARLPEKSRVL